MTARRTARSVYGQALISAGMTESGLLLVMAEALRAAEGRKSASFLEMIEDGLDYLEGRGVFLPMADALRDVRIKNDPPDVVREHLQAVAGVADLVFQDDDTFQHATKKANRDRLAALMKALASAMGDEASGNVKPFPSTDVPTDDIDEAAGLVEAGRTASEIRRSIEDKAASKVETFKDAAADKKSRAAERATERVDEFLDEVADIVRETLIGTFRGPELGRKALFVRRRGAPSMAEFNACVSKIDEKWAATVRNFKTADLVPVLPDQFSRTPTHSLSLPETALPQLGWWERIKLRARSAGTVAGAALGILGAATAYFLGFDPSSLSIPALLTALTSHTGCMAGIGMVLVGGAWAMWSRLTGAEARLDLEKFCIDVMRNRRKELIALLTDPFDACVDATVAAYEAVLKRETETETAILRRVAKTASELGFKAKARARSGAAAQPGSARKSA